jgi:hypothetical protein
MNFFQTTIREEPVRDSDGNPVLLPDGEPETKKIITKVPFVQDKETGEVGLDNSLRKEHEQVGDFDVKVNTISGLPFAKAEKESRLFNLYDRQIISGDTVLKELDFPNWEEERRKAKEEQAEIAQAQQAPA